MSTAELSQEVRRGLVKQLREETLAPYQDCVWAVNESDGDLNAAKELLKQKGQSIELASRPDNGYLTAAQDAETDALVFVTGRCQTDFVAKNLDFMEAVQQAANSFAVGRDEGEVTQRFKDAVWKFKEEIGLEVYRPEPTTDYRAVYLHHDGRRAAYLTYTADKPASREVELALAAQVVAMAPREVNVESVDQLSRAKFIAAATEQAVTEGKPQQIAEKIANGKYAATLKEYVYTEQPFYADTKKTAGQFAAEHGVTVTSFVSLMV
ncbi:MAG: hypothetical protein JSS66_06305 [Armatimonadetes bacterium]|nr:hypothetical protein [Armatimonadota bacterium]